MHFQWQGLSTTLTRPVDRLWRLIAQMTLLGGCYTGDIEKCYNSTFLAVNAKFNFSVPVFQIGKMVQIPRSTERISRTVCFEIKQPWLHS